jgi:hypothetical protein
MRALYRFLACSLLLNVACVPPTPHPPPAAPYVIGIVAQAPDQSRVADASVQLHEAAGYVTQTTGPDGLTVFTIPASLTQSDVIIDATHFDTFRAHVDVVNQKNYFYTLTPSTPPFPPTPTRAQALAVKMTFQGLMCHTNQFGDLPWFDAALFSLTPADRQLVYACKHAAGDTHAIIGFDTQTGSIYDEPGQPYQQMNGPGFELHLPAYVAAVKEVIANGFIPVIFLGGDGPNNRPIAEREFPISFNALRAADVGDLNRYVLYLPGWDSVFYGWEPANTVFPAFGAMVKAACSYCLLGLEFNTGHIPIGNGPSDWVAGGAMKDWDALFVEFNDGNIHTDSTWQVLARLLGPAYHRPADQPSGDDPRPPFYLVNGTAVVCFEYAEYEWVRGYFTKAQIDTMRAYLYSVGCPVVN